jgi:hypothetical protein
VFAFVSAWGRGREGGREGGRKGEKEREKERERRKERDGEREGEKSGSQPRFSSEQVAVAKIKKPNYTAILWIEIRFWRKRVSL